MAGHAQLKFVMTECSKTQIRLTGLILCFSFLIMRRNKSNGLCEIIKKHFVRNHLHAYRRQFNGTLKCLQGHVKYLGRK